VVALTYAEVVMLKRAHLENILLRYPNEERVVRKAYVRVAFQAAIRREARRRMGKKPNDADAERNMFLAFTDPVESPLIKEGKIEEQKEAESASAINHARMMHMVQELFGGMREELSFRLGRLEENVHGKVRVIQDRVDDLDVSVNALRHFQKTQVYMDLEDASEFNRTRAKELVDDLISRRGPG